MTPRRRNGRAIKRVALGIFGVLLGFGGALPASIADDEEKPEVEAQAQLPDPPKADNLIEFYVSEVTTNRFFVDSASLSVGADGAIRYTAVIKSAAGARNVSFEGIRCGSWERRLYAFGRPDNSWSKARNSAWAPVTTTGPSRYQYVLMREYFCPDGIPIRDAVQGLEALRRGASSAGNRYIN